MRRASMKIGRVVVLVITAFSSSFAMTNGMHVFTPMTDLSRVINEKGWTVSGLSRAKIVSPRTLVNGREGELLYITLLQPRTETIATVPIFWLTENGSILNTREQTIAVRSIERYDVDQHVFCYVQAGVGSSYDEKTKRGGYGGQFVLIYYDNDGDGIFESFELGNSAKPFIPVVPAWVKTAK